MIHTGKVGPARFLAEQVRFVSELQRKLILFLTYSKYLIHNNSITPSERKKTKLGISNSRILCYY